MRSSKQLWLLTVAVALSGCKQATPPPVVTQPVAPQPVRTTPAPTTPVVPTQVAPPAKPVAQHRKTKPAGKQKCATGYDCTHVWSTYVP